MNVNKINKTTLTTWIMELSFPRTFVPWNFRSHSQSNVVSLPTQIMII